MPPRMRNEWSPTSPRYLHLGLTRRGRLEAQSGSISCACCVSRFTSDANAAYATGALVTGLLEMFDPLDPARRAPRAGADRLEDKPPEPPELVLSPRSLRFLSMSAPYRTTVSKAMWMYRNNQPQITTGGLETVVVMVGGRVRTSEASARIHWARGRQHVLFSLESDLSSQAGETLSAWCVVNSMVKTDTHCRTGAARLSSCRGSKRRIGDILVSCRSCSEPPSFSAVLISIYLRHMKAEQAALSRKPIDVATRLYEEIQQSRRKWLREKLMFGPTAPPERWREGKRRNKE